MMISPSNFISCLVAIESVSVNHRCKKEVWTKYSSFLVWFGKGFHLWVRWRGGSQHPMKKQFFAKENETFYMLNSAISDRGPICKSSKDFLALQCSYTELIIGILNTKAYSNIIKILWNWQRQPFHCCLHSGW